MHKATLTPNCSVNAYCISGTYRYTHFIDFIYPSGSPALFSLLLGRLHSLPGEIILLRRTLHPTRHAPLLHIHALTPSLHIYRLMSCLLPDLLLRMCMLRLLDSVSIDQFATRLGVPSKPSTAGVDVGVALLLGDRCGELALGAYGIN